MAFSPDGVILALVSSEGIVQLLVAGKFDYAGSDRLNADSPRLQPRRRRAQRALDAQVYLMESRRIPIRGSPSVPEYDFLG
jgi:hypothetical protein